MSAFDLKLDASQKSKIQKVIAHEVNKYSSYSDDVIPEYIMVMVQNKKTAAEVKSQLEAFLGKDSAVFTDWLWEMLDGYSKGKPLPSAEPEPQEQQESPEDKMEVSNEPAKPKLASVIAKPEEPTRRDKHRDKGRRREKDSMDVEEKPKDVNAPSRLVLNAVKQAAEDTKEVKGVESQSPKVKRKLKSISQDKEGDEDIDVTVTLDGGSPSKKRASLEVEDNNEKIKRLRAVKCQYWPNCKRGDACMYHHPKERCKNFPKCNYGDACLFIHPSSDVACKFGLRCTRADCTFTHPTSIPCKNGFACYLWNGSNCTYNHPMEACKFGDKCTKGEDCNFSHETVCKFGSRCTKPGCSFAHLLSSTTTKPGKASSPVPCKFGSACKNKDTTCTFTHPEEGPVDTAALSDSLPKTPPKE